MPADDVRQAIILFTESEKFGHLAAVIVGIRRSDEFRRRVQGTDQIVCGLPERTVKIAVCALPGSVGFVPDFVSVIIAPSGTELALNDGFYAREPAGLPRPFIRPAGQNIRQPDLYLCRCRRQSRRYL